MGYFCMKFYYQELSKIVKSGRIGLWSNKATREIKKTIYCRFHFTAAKTITQSPGKFPFFFFSAALNCCFLACCNRKQKQQQQLIILFEYLMTDLDSVRKIFIHVERDREREIHNCQNLICKFEF